MLVVHLVKGKVILQVIVILSQGRKTSEVYRVLYCVSCPFVCTDVQIWLFLWILSLFEHNHFQKSFLKTLWLGHRFIQSTLAEVAKREKSVSLNRQEIVAEIATYCNYVYETKHAYHHLLSENLQKWLKKIL